MIQTVTLRPFPPFDSKALVKNGLAVVADLDGFWVYHLNSGLVVLGYPIVGAKNALNAVRELLATKIDWELPIEAILKSPKEALEKGEEIRIRYRFLHSPNMYTD